LKVIILLDKVNWSHCKIIVSKKTWREIKKEKDNRLTLA
jgi:hypothetical protein